MNAAPERARHGIVHVLAGTAVALAAVTMAWAAIPQPHPAPAPVAPTVEPAPEPLVSFATPVAGEPVISPWGLRRLPWERQGRLHAGVDIAAPSGAPIASVADGIVVAVGEGGGYGRYVEVRHLDGLTSFYGHLGGARKGLRVGSSVKGGEPIARIGDTGVSTGPHLHFEIRHEGEPVNPVLFLNRAFMTAQDLPFAQASQIPRHVRVAYVSTIPESKRDQMAALDGKSAKAVARRATVAVRGGGEVVATEAPASGADGRVYARINLGD